MSDMPAYVLEREFDAPRALVWKAWTDPALLPRWYGPRVETIVHRLELNPGGLWLLEMRWDGNSHHQRVEYTEVTPPERLVWWHSVSDADWNIIANPMMSDWPRVLLTTVTFEESGGRTGMRLTWVPHEASESEIACFAAAVGGMDKGGGPGWSCSRSCWLNCRFDLVAGRRIVRLVCWRYGAARMPIGGRVMRRFTIGSADRMHLALKEAAARQNRSMDPIVEESLELRGIRLCGTTKDYELRWVSRLRFDLLDEVFHGGFVTGVPGITS